MIRGMAFVAAATVAGMAPGVAQAIELDYVGARAGTLGVGGEIGVSLIPTLSARLVANGGSFDPTSLTGGDYELDGLEYSGEASFGNFGAHLDFKPIPLFPLYASVGVYANDNSLELKARPTTATQIGDVTFTPTQIGELQAGFGFEDIAPYAGLGARFTLLKVQFNFEGGVLFQGSPQATLAATGTLATDQTAAGQTFRAELEKERQRVQDELDGFEVYPVLNASLRYKF